MTEIDELREAVARNICVQLYGRTWGDTKPPRRAVCFDVATVALRVVREAMREPSDGMVHQGGAAHDHPSVYMGGPSHNGRTKAERIWRAMWAASPLREE